MSAPVHRLRRTHRAGSLALVAVLALLGRAEARTTDDAFLTGYLTAVLENGSADRNAIPYPSGPEDFWELVERGRHLLTNSGSSNHRLSSSAGSA